MKDKSLIIRIIDLLKIDEFNGVGLNIDIAKGRDDLPTTKKGLINTIKRNRYYVN